MTRKALYPSLGSLLTEASPIFTLPAAVLRQLVGYYGDWRRSRDILNEVDETAVPRALPRLFTSTAPFPGSSNSFRTQ